MAKLIIKFIVLFTILILLIPTDASALGVDGFDIYRPAAKNPDSGFSFDLKPGESTVDRVMLENTSETVQNIRIYVADARLTSNGGIALKERLDKKTGLAKWITIKAPEDITLQPGEKRLIKFRLKVPNSSGADEKMAGIIVERATSLKSREDQQFQINIIPRVAILINQRLPGPAIERLKIIEFGYDWEKRDIVFDLGLKNTGNIHLKPDAKIQIYDMFGRKSDSIEIGKMATLFPGRTSRISRVWQNTPIIGYYSAEVYVEYGEKNKSESRWITILIFPWWVLPIVLALWIIARQQRKRRAARKKQKAEDAKAIADHRELEGTRLRR